MLKFVVSSCHLANTLGFADDCTGHVPLVSRLVFSANDHTSMSLIVSWTHGISP